MSSETANGLFLKKRLLWGYALPSTRAKLDNMKNTVSLIIFVIMEIGERQLSWNMIPMGGKMEKMVKYEQAR